MTRRCVAYHIQVHTLKVKVTAKGQMVKSLMLVRTIILQCLCSESIHQFHWYSCF